MSRIFEFIVNEVYVVPCRYQVAADSEVEARRKAERGDTVQIEIDGREELTARNVADLVSIFSD
jgi:hypothetical protein